MWSPPPSRSASSRRAFFAVAVVAGLSVAGAVSCRGGCGGGARPETRPLGGRLALFPIETQFVAAIDFTKLRATPVAAQLAGLAARSAADQQQIDAFTQRTGLDPLKQIDSLLVGFPDEARRRGELALVMRASRFDQARLVAYARDTLQKTGDDLVSTPRGHVILWSARKDPGVAGFFLDDRTFVLGASGWAEKMADLSGGGAPAGASAETNLELVGLCQRAAQDGDHPHALWAAALISAETRRRFQTDPELKNAASVLRMALGIDLQAGLEAALTADLSTPAEAQALASRVTETLRDAKRNPLVLMGGLGPDLDSVTTRAEGATFRLRLSLGEAQVSDLLGRAAALLDLSHRALVPGFRAP